MSDFLKHLRQRKLVQWAAAYIAAAFALLQGIDIVATKFGWPVTVERLLIIAICVGFFITLLLAWYHGEQGRQRASGTELLLVALVLAVGGGFLWKFAGATASHDRMANTATPANQAASATPPTSSLAAIPAKSIAVLPFENLSSDKDNAYFADGIQDEVLTRLAKIGTLKVISRTSTMRYASRPGDLSEIARQLGVANVLEGSVQKAGDAVRINVQLIRAAGDSHLWAETYDRKLDNVFGVESEVATAIADALDAKLSNTAQVELARRPTTNGEAWAAYLRGVSLADRPELAEADQREAIASFEKAVKLDPSFAVAWAALSTTDAGLVFIELDSSTARREAAKSALAQAVRLQPDAFETRRAQAYYAYFVNRDYDDARTLFENIRPLAPNDAEIPLALALIARRAGRWDDSVNLFDQALDLDPRNLKVLLWASDTHAYLRQFPAALALLGRLTDITPTDAVALSREAAIYEAMGDLERAQAVVARMAPPLSVEAQINLLRLQRHFGEGVALIRKASAARDANDLSDRSGLLYFLGEFQRLSGNTVGAKASYTEGLDDVRKELSRQPDNVDLLWTEALLDAQLDDREGALRAARSAIALLPASKDRIDGPRGEEVLVLLQTRLGDKAAAIAGIEHLLSTPYPGLWIMPLTPALLRLDPAFDPLRDDPRFRKLAQMPDAPPKTTAMP